MVEPVIAQGLIIHYPVLVHLDAQTETCGGALEDGGILLGRYRGPHIEVLDFTRSGAKDKRRPFSFTRQDPKHQKHAIKAWGGSSQTTTFIGEWHTHPSGPPTPSGIDTESWRGLVKAAREPMVFVVVAPGQWLAYLCQPNALRKRPLLYSKVGAGDSGIVFQVNRD